MQVLMTCTIYPEDAAAVVARVQLFQVLRSCRKRGMLPT